MAKDPGNSLRAATKITVKKASRTLRDFVGASDRLDFYSFSLAKISSFNLSLKGLKANADVFLLSKGGKILAKSRKAGRKPEEIITTLAKGTYYIKVSTRTRRDNTSYRLTVSTRNTVPELTTNNVTQVGLGGIKVINGQLLKVTDAQQNNGQLTYTLTQLPTYGRLELDGEILTQGSQFTQADINSGRLNYTHIGWVKQLTNNGNEDYAAGISGANALLNSFDGTDFEVSIYNGTTNTTKVLTNNGVDDFASGISGGNAVWTSYDSSQTPKSFFYNGTTNTITPLVTPGLTSSDVGLAPVIIGSNVIWTGVSNFLFFQQLDLFFYNSTTNTVSQLTNDTIVEAAVGASGSYAVFNELDAATLQSTEVFLYNATTGTATQLSNNSGSNSAIGISGTKVYWNGSDGHDYEIFVYDINTGQTSQLTNNQVDDVTPVATGLSGANLIWNSFDGNDFEAFFYNGSTKQKIQLTNNNTDDLAIAISGSNVVWSSSDGNGQPADVFFYNGATGQTTQITKDTLGDFVVGVSGFKLVWNHFDSTDTEAFMTQLDHPNRTDQFRFSVTDGVGGRTSGTYQLTIA
jgi:Tol biopolymer transport system component